MIVGHEQQVEAKAIASPEVMNAAMKALIGPSEGWEDHVMRIIELGPDGYTPSHAHDWPHINFMIEGEGTLVMDGKSHAVAAGAFAYVPSGAAHQFRNAGSTPFRFICIVPVKGHIV